MATDTESFNRDLYDLLKVRGYAPVPLDAKNERVTASQDSDVIEFQFTKDNKDYGKVWITIDDAQNIIVYYDNEQQESPSTRTPGVDYDDSWTGLLKFIKNWAQRRQMSFELANKDRLGDDMRQREYYKMKEKLGEGYHSMGKKASYNDAVPNVKIVLQHNRALEEGEQRYRNIARIYLENVDGERFLAPTNRPGIARVYARHIAEGGVPNDDRWNHIKSICEDYNKMAGFVRATRNGQFNESAQELVTEGINHYNGLRETLHKMTGHRGYQAYFESWTPALMENEGDESINELFVQETMDPRIESAMPILSRLRKPVAEMSEIDTLAEWADSIISEKLDMNEEESIQSNNPIGIPEGILDKQTFIIATKNKDKKEEFQASDAQEAMQLAMKKWGLKSVDDLSISQAQDDAATKTPDVSTPDLSSLPPVERAKAKAALDKSGGVVGGIGKVIGGALGIREGDVIPFKKKKHDDDDDDDSWLDDDSWIPSIEDFEQEEAIRNRNREYQKRKRTPANDVNEMDKSPEANPYSGQGHSKSDDHAGKPQHTAKMMAAKDAVKAARKSLDKAFNKEVDENFIGMAPQAVAEEEVEEGLDANQKRVGQLGPTEKVKNNNIGKLVGGESKEIDSELARIMEIAKFKR